MRSDGCVHACPYHLSIVQLLLMQLRTFSQQRHGESVAFVNLIVAPRSKEFPEALETISLEGPELLTWVPKTK